MRLQGLDKLKKKLIYLIGSRTRDLPACSVGGRGWKWPRIVLCCAEPRVCMRLEMFTLMTVKIGVSWDVITV
jgi:hypothetical protein